MNFCPHHSRPDQSLPPRAQPGQALPRLTKHSSSLAPPTPRGAYLREPMPPHASHPDASHPLPNIRLPSFADRSKSGHASARPTAAPPTKHSYFIGQTRRHGLAPPPSGGWPVFIFAPRLPAPRRSIAARSTPGPAAPFLTKLRFSQPPSNNGSQEKSTH